MSVRSVLAATLFAAAAVSRVRRLMPLAYQTAQRIPTWRPACKCASANEALRDGGAS